MHLRSPPRLRPTQVCFGVYLFMGLVMMIMGGLYWSDAGAVGATAVYLLLIGFFMLIIGGLSIFANLKKIWPILFFIELFNVGLFLAMYITIIIVVMMASGSSDPVRKATKESWSTLVSDLTWTGSDGAGGIYCQTETAGTACDNWWSTTLGPSKAGDTDGCLIPLEELGSALANCSSLQVATGPGGVRPDWFADSGYPLCASHYPTCISCNTACMEASISKVKDQMLPASYFTFFLCGYLVIVVCFNQIALGADEIEGILKIVGLVLNGLVVLFSFIAFIMAILGLVDANEACPIGQDCVPTSMIFLIILGFALLVLGGLATGGIQLGNNMMLRISTLVMIFASIALLLAALLMGISSGAVMDDMGYYYDTNYPKLRAALEKGDNSYCQLNKADCETITYTTTSIYPQRCNDAGAECENIVTDGDSPYGANYQMDGNQVWNDQYAILAAMARAEGGTTGANSWLEPCKTTGICIYCDDFYTSIETDAPKYVANAPPLTSTCTEAVIAVNEFALSAPADKLLCDAQQTDADACEAILTTVTTDAGTVTACVYASSAGNCAETVEIMGGTSVLADKLACNAVATDAELGDATACNAVNTDASIDTAPTCLMKATVANAATTNAVCTALITATLGSPMNGAECTANLDCEFVAGYVKACTYQARDDYISADNLNWKDALAGSKWDDLVLSGTAVVGDVKLKNYETAFPYDATNGFATGNTCVETATTTSVPADVILCAAAVMTEDNVKDAATCGAVTGGGCSLVVAPMTPAEWTSTIGNFTTFNDKAKFSMPKCETALTDYTSNDLNCPEVATAAGEYSSDCKSCNGILTPFAFNVDTGMSDGDQQKCLNFFVGHLKFECGGGGTTCIDEVRPTVLGRCEDASILVQADCGEWTAVPTETVRKGHIDPIIVDAIAGLNNWCGYTDTGCKIKIQNTIENSMSTIGILGVIFLVFFLAIIFFTEQGILIYKNGDDDDDDDDDDGDDDSDE